MALFGVSSGAVQFMAYEQMKNVAFARKKKKVLEEGGTWKDGEEKLVRFHQLLHFVETLKEVPYRGAYCRVTPHTR